MNAAFFFLFLQQSVSDLRLKIIKLTRPDTGHKMRQVRVLFTFEYNTGRTDGRTYERTYGQTDTTSYRDATAHLKIIRSKK